MFKSAGSQGMEIRKSEFVSKIQFLSIFNFSTTIFAFFPTRHLSLDVHFLKKMTQLVPRFFHDSFFKKYHTQDQSLKIYLYSKKNIKIKN